MVILGTSLNGFGKKQSFVIQAGPDIRQTLLAEFDHNWILQRRGHSGSLSEFLEVISLCLEIGVRLAILRF